MEDKGYVCQKCYNNNKKKRQEQQPEAPSTPQRAPMAVRRTQSAPLPLSPEQTQQLHSAKKADGVGKQGLSMPTGTRARMVLYIDTIQTVTSRKHISTEESCAGK
jgi:hypothetical protein